MKKCHIKMLRYFYLLSLLISINFSFCYEYSIDKDLNGRPMARRLRSDYKYQNENLQRRKHLKRHDYDVYDKDPVAEIDVVSFINSADYDSNENDPYNLEHQNVQSNSNYDSLNNVLSNSIEDYSDVDTENLEDNSHYVKFNSRPEGKAINKKLTPGFDKVSHESLDDNVISQYNKPHKEKKCLLKNIKIPFFSHNKSAIAKSKLNKKRKLYGNQNLRKESTMFKENNINLSNQDNSPGNLHIYKHNAKKKRSYIGSLCPACRKRFIISNSLTPQDKRYNLKNTYNMKQNNKKVEYGLSDNQKNINSYDVDNGTPEPTENSRFENAWTDKRRKREDDDRNIERQKELEYLAKRIDSVTINNLLHNKGKL